MKCIRKKAKIRNQYNQIPHLTQGIIKEMDKTTRKYHIQESQEVSPFPASDYKVAMNRYDSITDKNANTYNRKDQQQKSIALERSVFCLFVFVALRPKSTAMVIAGRSVHLTTLFSWASLNKRVTSNSCTYFRL